MDQNHKPQWMENEAMCGFFHSLPAYVQENIMQSSKDFTTMQELRECAQKLQNR